jgi:beta-phosphoglucomutase-like phosphatase (HAD superfamily)
MVRAWQRAFERAAHEVQVEILKERIRKAWGKSLDSIADSVIELMMKDWEATQGREKAAERKEKAWEALVEKIAAAYNKGPK